MKFSELFRQDRQLLQGKPLAEKLRHIWLYYKWYFAAFLLAVIYTVTTVISNISLDNCILNGAFLNTSGNIYAVSEIGADYLAVTGKNAEGKEVYFDSIFTSAQPDAADAASAYESFQLLIAQAHTGDLDFIVTDNDVLNHLIYNEFLVDLEQVLSAEQQARYSPCFLYMDMAFLEQLRNASFTVDPSADGLIFPDPRKPELMENPVAVLIDLQGSKIMSKLYLDSSGSYAFGLVVNGAHWEEAVRFLDYLMQETNH